MASVFGLSGLRTKLDDWRGLRSDRAPVETSTSDGPGTNKPRANHLSLAASSDKDFDLSFLLENLVIPKLIADRDNRSNWMTVTELSNSIKPARQRAIAQTDIDDFTELAVSGDAEALLDFIDHCLATGSSVETIYVELLAPAARKLGEMWEADSQDFVGVTMGLWRIQEILRELTTRIPPQAQPGPGQRSGLFSAMPGEQHSFGTLMVAECFQRAGWETDVLIEPTLSELTARYASQHFDMIGLTVSNDCPMETLASLIKTIRAVSCNPLIKVLLGGRVINDNPGLAQQCGADGTASDAKAAVLIADQLVPIKVACLANLA
jgi:MerR family transcriptional regulator, light-induced transcriptional regulator